MPPGLRRAGFAAMGTEVVVLLPAPHAAEAVSVRSLFSRWEAILSRFLPDSELSWVNRQSGMRCQLSPLMAEVVAAALDAARATGGLFDPALAAQVSDAGYERSFAELPPELAPRERPARPGGQWRHIAFDPHRRTLRLPPGVGLDLGGIAKGMAVDAAAARLRRAGVGAGLVSAGGDLAVWGLPPGHRSWPVAIAWPGGSTVVPLQRGSLATSGIARRRWRQGREERHHLIDPRAGVPAAAATWSVSVVGPTCRQAEVAAKVAFVLGAGGPAYLVDHGLDALIVSRQGHPRPIGAWPAPHVSAA